jgi:hypothetical protein
MNKNIISQLKKAVCKIRDIYKKHTIRKLIITFGSIFLIAFILYIIPVLHIKKQNLNLEKNIEKMEDGQKIEQDSGEVLLTEMNGRQLYFDTVSMKLRIVDTTTKAVWKSYMEGVDSGDEMSLISVKYLGEDNNLNEWNSYDYCTSLKSYELYKIDNGIRIDMHLNEGESTRFYEYLPKKMSIERFQEFFVNGLEKLKDDGTVTEAEYNRYKTTLSLAYKKSIMEECYAVTYTGTPPASAVSQMIELVKLLGYTKEMLVADSKDFGYDVSFEETPDFSVKVYITLEKGDLVIRIPSLEMESYNNYYTIQNIKVLPNFGAVTADQCEEGYIFVPDGSGALINMNSYQAGIPDYIRPVYNNDYYADYYFMPEYGEELNMPVYGMTYGKDQSSTSGFLAIIEKGAETSYVNVKLSSKKGSKDGSKYNKAYASFDVDQYTNVNVDGPYSDETATYLVDTGVMIVDYTVRFKLFNDKVTYFDMAKSYQDYLVEQGAIDRKYDDGAAKIYLETIGSLSIKKRILGIPYDTIQSMTTYQELENIINDLSETNMIIGYDGVFNNGLNNKLNNTVRLVSENGKKSDFNNLITLMKDQNIDFYPGVALSRVYTNGNGFSSRIHAVKDFSNSIASIYRYNAALGVLSGYLDRYADYYKIVSPYYLNNVVNGFIKDSDEYGSLFISDLANMYYADYDNSDMVDAYEADYCLQNSLDNLSSNKKLALYDPLIKNIKYGNIAVSISRESSEYATFETTIPFRQLVMNGLTKYTTQDVNMSSKSPEYYVLQSVELASYPKFTITSKSTDILRNTNYSYLYSTQYKELKETINDVYTKCESARAEIGSNEITNHERLSDNVFETTYANGVKTIVNYNLFAVQLDDGIQIDALGFRIIKGEEGME